MVAVGPEVSINEPLMHEQGVSGHQNHLIIHMQGVKNESGPGLTSNDMCTEKEKGIFVWLG